MIYVAFRERDARFLRENVKGANVVYPSNRQMLQLLKLYMRLNRDVKIISNNVIWGQVDPTEYQKVVAELTDAVERMRAVVGKVREVVNSIPGVKSGSKPAGNGDKPQGK